MSLFKVKEWWTNDKLKSEECSNGMQNGACIKVDKFNLHSDSDCLIVGEGSQLKVYKPDTQPNASDTILELQLDMMVLQVETGKFTVDAEDRQILILHSQSYLVYNIFKKGDQNVATQIIKHSFTRKAYNMAIGPFGNSKARDLICIQTLDGSLSIFDQDTFLFMYIFNDIIIPGPICYIASSDLFVISKSNWVMEIYSYQQLEEFSELNARQNKKNIPQWIYNVGEEVLSVQAIRTSSTFSSVVALGERHLYCFQDNGLMKYILRFDYMPICFYAYLIGWYYEPSARLLVMVASDDSKLFIYEGTSLLWSCDLLGRVISLLRCFVNSLPGGLVTLSTKGIINVYYLGTEPDLNSNAAPIIDPMDPRQVQKELEAVEKSLQKVLDHEEENNDPIIDEIIKIKIDVGRPVQNLYPTSMNEAHQALHLLMCPIVIMLTCEDPKLVQSIQITNYCCPPFECSEPAICLDTINGTEIIEIQVFLSTEAHISDTWMNILFTIIDAAGKIYVLSHKVLLPLSLYCSPVTQARNNDIQIVLIGSHPCVDLKEIFTDFSKEELSTNTGPLETVSFVYRSTNNYVKIKNEDHHYIVEACEFSDMSPLLDNFISKLKDYHQIRLGANRFAVKFQLNMELVKQILHKFLKSVETHAKERMNLKVLENELNILQRQFTLIQKRLLVQYGSLPPGDCDPLEFLMRDTHDRIIKSAGCVIESREKVCRSSCTLSAIGNLLTNILKHTITDKLQLKLVEEMLSFSNLYEHTQEWEEAVIQAASYILNSIIKKSEKDREKLATITDQDVLSQTNLKKFLKQLRIVLEKMFTGATTEHDSENIGKTKDKITRIEELVEVI